MITYTYQVNNIIRSSDDLMRVDDIIGAHVYITAIDEDKTYASLTAWVPFSKDETFIDYASVTPEMIDSWLTTNPLAIQTIDTYKTQLVEMIDNIKNPPPPTVVLPEPLVIEENGLKTVVNPVSMETIVNEAIEQVLRIVSEKVKSNLLVNDRAQYITYVTNLINQAKTLDPAYVGALQGSTHLLLGRVDTALDEILNHAKEREDVKVALIYLLNGTQSGVNTF